MSEIFTKLFSYGIHWLWLYGSLVVASIVIAALTSRMRRRGGRTTLSVTTHSYLKRFRRIKHKGWRLGLGLTASILILFGALFVFSSEKEDGITPTSGARSHSQVVLVLVDISSSMSGSKQLIPYEAYKKVAAKGLATGLILYSDSAYLARYPTRNQDLALRASIDEETIKGVLRPVITGTDTASAIYLAQEFLSEYFPETPSVLVLISDLNDNGLKISGALSRFVGSDLVSRLYVIQVGSSRGSREVSSILMGFRDLETKIQEVSRLEEISLLDSFFGDFPQDGGESFIEDTSKDENSKNIGNEQLLLILGIVLASSILGFFILREILIRKVD